MKFKIGDQVERIEHNWEDIKIGDRATIVEVCSNGKGVKHEDTTT